MARNLDMASLAELVGSIYEAALEPSRWAVTLPRLVTALHADRGFMGFTSHVRGHTLTTVSHEVDPEMLREWQQDFAGFDPWYEKSGALATGTVVQGLEVLPWDELRSADVHAAVFHRYGFDDLICTSVANHGRAFDFVTVHRSLRNGAAAFDEADVRAMRFLAPHLVRAAQLHDKLSFLADAEAAHASLLDRLPYGVVLLGPGGRPLTTNREADRIFAAGDGLGLRSDAIHATHSDAQRRLAAAIAATCDPAPRERVDDGALLAVPRRHSLRSYQVLVAPVPPRARERIFESVATRVVAVLVLSDPETAPEPAADTLARLFALTPATARLAAALAAGQTVAEYADAASITQGTARGYLKELFSRTGTGRQAELVRLLLSGIAQLECPDRGERGA